MLLSLRSSRPLPFTLRFQLFLCSVIVGYWALVPAGITVVGYILFGNGYTQATHKRIFGVVLASIGRYTALVLLIGLIIKGLSL